MASEAAVDWAAQAFMFAYALGGSAVAPETVPAETDRQRVEDLVDLVIAIAESDGFAVSSERVREDLRG